LTALNLDAARVRRGGERVQGPLRRAILLRWRQRPIALAYGPARRRQGDEGQHRTPVGFRQAAFAPGAGAIAEPIDSLRIEADDAFPYGLWMTPEFGRDDRGPESVPTPEDHPRAQDPISGGMAAAGELPNLARFTVARSWSRKQELGHTRLQMS
jgi:hypothetical protein